MSHLWRGQSLHSRALGHHGLSIVALGSHTLINLAHLFTATILCHHLHMQIVVPLVSPEVFRAWQSFSEETQYRQDGVTGNFLVDLLKLSRVNSLLALEAGVQDPVHIVQGLHSLLEVVETSTLLSELSFSAWADAASALIDHWETSQNGGDIILADESIAVEIVNLKNELSLLIEAGAIQSEKTSEEFPLVEVPVVVGVHHVEESLSEHTWQLCVIKQTDLVDTLSWLVRSSLQILEDILEVWEANLGFKVLVGLKFNELQLVVLIVHNTLANV